MVKAFVMLNLTTTEYMGLTKTIVEEASRIPGVTNAHAIFGRYDVIVEVEVKGLSELTNLVQDKLRVISGVLSTETFICYV